MFIHYQELLTSIVASPSAPLSKLSMLPAEERHQLLEVFNETSAGYATDKTLVDLFAEQVKRAPSATAIAFEGETLTYQALDEQSNQLAHHLLAKGLATEEAVGVCLERGPALIISILAILKSGGVYVPIDPAYPVDRISYMLEDASIGILLSSSDLTDQLSAIAVKEHILVDAVATAIQAESRAAPVIDLSASNLAYIIYTSGSTGKPKGVLIEHAGIGNTIQGQIDLFSLSGNDHCLQYASPSFDASIWEILLSLLSGAQLCIIPESQKYEVDYFVDYVAQQAISFATLPPAFFKLLDVRQLSGIKTLVTAGEEAPYNNAKAFSQTGRYFNAYGPTETSICATIYHGEIDRTVPIGSPVANASAYLLNQAMELVPVGAVGELCVGGAGLARGYLNRESLTQECFVPHPFKAGARLYKTGDLARWRPDGSLEFMGRKDSQVKVRGYRIELGEVEHAVSLVQGVQQCCVLASADSHGQNRLVAYVVTAAELDKEALQAALRERLPEYMVPQLWIQLDEMPLTSSGKVDKKALPEPDGSALSSKEYVAPRTETEKQLAAIWQELLGVDQVEVHDYYFELGVHSLIATRQDSKIR